jgi:hypothetical protein
VAPQVVRLGLRLRDLGLPVAMRTADLADAIRGHLKSKVPSPKSKVGNSEP